MRTTGLLFAMLACVLCAGFARAADEADPLAAKGQTLYRAYCQTCHGADASHPVVGVKNLSEFTGDEPTFEGIVKNGRNAMPAHSYLSTDDFAALYAYVKSK